MMAPGCVQNELTRRCEVRGLHPTVTAICGVLGKAVDAGMISLPELTDLVNSCSTVDQLGDALVMLAASATAQDWPPVGCPPGHEHRVFRVVGYSEEAIGVPTWNQ